MMRPSSFFAVLVLVLSVVTTVLIWHGHRRTSREMGAYVKHDILTAQLGLTDICLATEARYTRHPAVTDDLAPFMDYPAALEYFPTGLFWAPQ